MKTDTNKHQICEVSLDGKTISEFVTIYGIFEMINSPKYEEPHVEVMKPEIKATCILLTITMTS